MAKPCDAAEDGGLTAGLARLAALGDGTATADEVLHAAKRAFIDTCGVMLAGWSEPVVTRLAAASPDGDEASALVGGRRLSAEHAARLNGAAGHALDYDDVALHGHPSVVLVPAILAEAQRVGATGRQALAAYAVGFEAWVELCSRESDSYHLKSWHPTAVLGAVAATVAVSALNGLDEATARNALALAASFASGVIANFGSHAKPLQVGRAAAAAIEAVRLARAGLTGSGEALEGAHGLLAGISPAGRVDTRSPVRLPTAPHDWRLLEIGLSVKRYPVCYASHRVIDAVIALRRESGLRADALSAVTATLAPAPAATLRFAHPTTGLEAKFSLQHAVAAALVDGAVGFRQLSEAYVNRPDIAALYPRVSIEVVTDRPSDDQTGLCESDRVLVRTHDGQFLDSGEIRYTKGHARAPLTDAELADKFLDCAAHGDCRAGPRLLKALQRLEGAPSVAEVFA